MDHTAEWTQQQKGPVKSKTGQHGASRLKHGAQKKEKLGPGGPREGPRGPRPKTLRATAPEPPPKKTKEGRLKHCKRKGSDVILKIPAWPQKRQGRRTSGQRANEPENRKTADVNRSVSVMTQPVRAERSD